MNLPQEFIDRMAAQLGDELPAFLRSYEESYHRGLRVNPFKGGRELAAAALGAELLEQIPWEEDVFYLAQESRAGAAALHEAGAWYLQEPSAMIPATVLAPKPGEHVLDLCAAPGGKSTQLGLRMAGQGTLICNEPIRDRAKILSRNVERMGIPNTLVTCAYPDELARCWPEAFDAIQCDAPCSGEGMFRRHPETRSEWSPESPAGCAKRQREILGEAAKMLRPGGRLVYSTCTLNRVENEGVVEAFLAAHPDFELRAFELPGLAAPWGMLTIYPHRVRGEGHFVALLARRGQGSGMAWKVPQMDKRVQGVLAEAKRAFPQAGAANYLHPAGRDDRFESWTLHCLPELPEGKLPRVLRWGLHMGEYKKPAGRAGKAVFTPDHAWAESIFPPEMPRIDLTEEQARLYQAGQTIPAEGKGWALACFAGVVLGWGKISEGMMKNHYPKGLRR